jgi:phage terminase Nu1 subunit (DNA packaging protein)
MEKEVFTRIVRQAFAGDAPKYHRAIRKAGYVGSVDALSGTEIGELLGVSRAAVSLWAKDGCPKSNKGKFRLSEVVKWLEDRAAEKASLGEDFDPKMLSGSGEYVDDKARYLAAAADLKEIQVAEKRREILDRAEVHRVFGNLGGLLRGAGENLQRQFGAGALAIIDEVLEDLVQMVKGEFGCDDVVAGWGSRGDAEARRKN